MDFNPNTRPSAEELCAHPFFQKKADIPAVIEYLESRPPLPPNSQ